MNSIYTFWLLKIKKAEFEEKIEQIYRAIKMLFSFVKLLINCVKLYKFHDSN